MSQRLLHNFLAFQFGWLGCVGAAAYGLPLLGLLVAGIVTGWHLWRSPTPFAELELIAAAVAIGTLCDSALLATGWLSYPVGNWLPNIAPYWIIAMWAMFATTLHESLAWLTRSVRLAGVFGALLAPVAYSAGARIGALSLDRPVPALLAIAAVWAAALPILIGVARIVSPRRRSHVTAVTNHEFASNA